MAARTSLNTAGFTPAAGGAQDPDHLYLNLSIINSDVSNDGTDPAIVFTETRQNTIIQNPMEYNFSIVRFDMNGPGKDLPIFIPRIQTGQSDVNKTVYQITLSVNYNYNISAGFVGSGTLTSSPASGTIIWTPEVLDPLLAPTPAPPTTQQDVSTRYYWCTTYSHWLQIVNAAYQSALANLNAQFFAISGLNLITQTPFMTYNPTDNLFTLYADRNGFGDNGGVTTNRTSAGTTKDENFSLFFDTNMYGLFSNFKNLNFNLSAGRAYQIIIFNTLYQNILNVNAPPAPTAGSYWVIVQDYESTSSLWCPVDSIVFTTSLMPMVFEQASEPVVFGQSNIGSSTGVQGNFTPIITDTSLTMESAASYRAFFQYAPTAEYRLSNFVRSSAPLQQIQVSVFWKNRLNGQLYPLQMYNSSSVSIKCLFRRRGVVSYPHLAQMGYDV